MVVNKILQYKVDHPDAKVFSAKTKKDMKFCGHGTDILVGE